MIRRVVLWGLGLAGVAVLVVAGAAYWLLSGDGIRVALEQQASSWLEQPVHIASATGRIFPRLGIQLREVTIGEPARVTLSDVNVSTSLGALISGRIEDADVIISDSRIGLPLPLGPSNDEADSPKPRTAAVVPPVEIVSVRAIALRDVSFVGRGREITVSADAALVGSELRLTRFAASSGRTELEASGTVGLDPGIDGRFDASANRLDLDELLALAGAFLPENTSRGEGSVRPAPRIAAHITADAVSAASVDARKFSTDLTLEGQRIALDPLRFELFDGTYEGTLHATLGDTLDVRLTSNVAGLDVAQLAAFGGAPDTITGRLSGNGVFVGHGADVGAMLRSARGNASASIVDGSIKRLNVIRTVVLFFGRPEPDAPPGADLFDRIEAKFGLAQEVVDAQQFSLRSPDADIDGVGSLSLATKALQGTAELRLSEELSRQAGTDLVRFTREGNRVVLPARISGTLAEPRITIDTAAAARRGLRNEAERRLRGLFDKR